MRIIVKQLIITVLCMTEAAMVLESQMSAAIVPQDVKKTINITGTVTSKDGEPQIGVMVYVKGVATTTASSAMTDANGKYSLAAPSNAELVASLLGFKEQAQPVSGRSVVDFILEPENTILDEAVAIGYGTQSKLTLTGSVAQTSGRDLVKNSSVNISQGLAGRLSGVIVSNRTGEPGKDNATMFIRGRSTLGDNSPLIVIDGVPRSNEEFSRLSGDEIESVNVLKDASGAIYGARSANGVILVTTKRGKYNDGSTVTFNYDLGLQQPTRLVKMADAILYTKAYNDELAITGASPMYNETQIHGSLTL